MANNQRLTIKTALEIGSLAGELTPNNQAYVLNTINALLFGQQTVQDNEKKSNRQPYSSCNHQNPIT